MNKFAVRRQDIPREIVKQTSCNLCAVSEIFVPTPVSSLYREEHQEPDGSTSVTFRNDVHLLLNQKRLDRMTLQAFSEYLTANSSPDLSNLRKNVTDAELHQYVKSRSLQSMSELQAWASYLSGQTAKIKADYKLAKQRASQKSATDDGSDEK